MIEAGALLALLADLRKWIQQARARKQLRDERGQRAVEAILRAVNETTVYIAAQARGDRVSRNREAELSRNWTSAAAALHGIDDDLARRCEMKGAFWANPESWSQDDLTKARILLKQVSDDAHKLLGWGLAG
jgi:hypothetical protein